MTTRFFVEGRRFNTHLEAVTFAQAQARLMGRAVEIKAEVCREMERVERKWLATMHPKNFDRPLKKPAPLRILSHAEKELYKKFMTTLAGDKRLRTIL